MRKYKEQSQKELAEIKSRSTELQQSQDDRKALVGEVREREAEIQRLQSTPYTNCRRLEKAQPWRMACEDEKNLPVAPSNERARTRSLQKLPKS